MEQAQAHRERKNRQQHEQQQQQQPAAAVGDPEVANEDPAAVGAMQDAAAQGHRELKKVVAVEPMHYGANNEKPERADAAPAGAVQVPPPGRIVGVRFKSCPG